MSKSDPLTSWVTILIFPNKENHKTIVDMLKYSKLKLNRAGIKIYTLYRKLLKRFQPANFDAENSVTFLKFQLINSRHSL